jgi:hypothetical protein
LGAFIVVTLAVLAAGVFIIGSKEYLFSSYLYAEGAIRQRGRPRIGRRRAVGGVHSGTVLSHHSCPISPRDKVTVVMELE